MKNKKYKRGVLGFLLVLLLTVPSHNIYARAGGGGGGNSGGHSSHSSHSSRSRGRAHRVSSGCHISSGNSEDSQEKKFTFEDKVISGVVVIVLVTISIKRTREALKEIK